MILLKKYAEMDYFWVEINLELCDVAAKFYHITLLTLLNVFLTLLKKRNILSVISGSRIY